MKLQRVIPVSAALLMGLASMPALAGTSSVTNSWSTRDIKNGISKTNIKVHENYDFWRKAYSDANKHEYGVTVVTDNIDGSGKQGSYKGRPDKGNDDSSKFFEIDVYKADASSWAKEEGEGYRDTNVHVYEYYEFDGFDKTHTVSSGFSF